MKAIFVALILFAVAPVAMAQDEMLVDCSRAEQILDARPFDTWHEAYTYYKPFRGRCSDGALAEGLSAHFTRLLSKRWSRLSELQDLASKDPAFLDWVLLGVYYNPEETE